MPISMDQGARYVTQQSIYNSQMGKRLTNRRISFYQKKGFYGPASPFVRAEVAKKIVVKKRNLMKIFDKF